ncbi:MAG: DUF2179 domain-containing protein [Bacilli bacterium]|nr:DUF2179 domain-containing protein [Bacilli bacterium]
MLILCLKIFLARIIDVSLGTIRTIMTVKDKHLWAGMIGFFEVFVWLVIVQEVINTPNMSIVVAVFYSLGFMAGTIIGGYITFYFVKTPIAVQIITVKKKMADYLYDNGYGVSQVKVYGKKGIKDLLIVETTNKQFKRLMNLIKKYDDEAFVVVDERKYIYNGFYLRK